MQQALSAGATWMNGTIITISEASFPVKDWGLTHSDITYDVAPVRDGAFFRLNDYIDRFFCIDDGITAKSQHDQTTGAERFDRYGGGVSDG
jgi:hypothetical protein